MRRLMWIALAIMLAAISGQSKAAPSMPIYFVGDWCYLQQEDQATVFLLPSWSQDQFEECKEILSITDYGFSAQGNHCQPIETRLVADPAPSGTTYVATIIADCRKDGPVKRGKIRTLEFARYKGRLWITPR